MYNSDGIFKDAVILLVTHPITIFKDIVPPQLIENLTSE
jgi:hypothetical protein